jgi:hypothetical protein
MRRVGRGVVCEAIGTPSATPIRISCTPRRGLAHTRTALPTIVRPKGFQQQRLELHIALGDQYLLVVISWSSSPCGTRCSSNRSSMRARCSK